MSEQHGEKPDRMSAATVVSSIAASIPGDGKVYPHDVCRIAIDAIGELSAIRAFFGVPHDAPRGATYAAVLAIQAKAGAGSDVDLVEIGDKLQCMTAAVQNAARQVEQNAVKIAAAVRGKQ